MKLSLQVVAVTQVRMKPILLDRDGVINFESKYYIKSPDEWIPLPGSIEAIAILSQAGYTPIVVTNQSGVGRGLYDIKTLEAIHEKMRQTIEAAGGTLAAIFYCPHPPDEFCLCRKPEPGLLYQVRDYLQMDLTNVWAVGDSLRDLQAAEKVGCQPVLVKTGNGMDTFKKNQFPQQTLVFDDLQAVARYLTQPV